MSSYLKFSLLIVLGIFCSCSDSSPFSKGHFVRLKELPKLYLKAGSTHYISLEFEVATGFHVTAKNDLNPLLGTQLVMFDKAGFTFSTPQFEEAKRYKIKGVSNALEVYTHSFEVDLEVATDYFVHNGTTFLEGELSYQICNEKTCFFPRILPWRIPVNISSIL